MEAMKGCLARYSWIKEIEFREELPLTKVGKVAYRELEREEEERARATGQGGSSPAEAVA